MKRWLCPVRMLGPLLMLGSLAGACRADAIHLKDGTTITADTVTEKDGQVDYTVGGTHYAVPKSSVTGIDRGSSFGITIGTSRSGWIAAPADSASAVASGGMHHISHSELAAALPWKPPVVGADSAALSARVVGSSGVSERALHEIEEEGDASSSAEAYLLASRYAYDHDDPDAAQRYIRRCLDFEPEQAGLLDWYAILLLDAGRSDEAVKQAERAVYLTPHSADALEVLGMADYDAGRFAEAIDRWKSAQQIHPNERIAAYLAKAEREAGVEGKFHERESAHFVLRYEGKQAAANFASELLATLDSQYGVLQRDLGFAPDITITVIVYTEQQFFDVTRAPTWADGINDGKIRVPVRDLSGVTPQLVAVLRHEMAHSFVHALTRGRCPTWLNEGIAQMEEPRSSADFAGGLARLFREGKAAPLSALEGPFVGLAPAQAQLAYAESLAATEYLRSNYGTLALRHLLQLLYDGEAPEDALNHAVHSNYEQFQSGLGAYLANNAR